MPGTSGHQSLYLVSIHHSGQTSGTESFLKVPQVQLGKCFATVSSETETLHGPGKLLKQEGNQLKTASGSPRN